MKDEGRKRRAVKQEKLMYRGKLQSRKLYEMHTSMQFAFESQAFTCARMMRNMYIFLSD